MWIILFPTDCCRLVQGAHKKAGWRIYFISTQYTQVQNKNSVCSSFLWRNFLLVKDLSSLCICECRKDFIRFVCIDSSNQYNLQYILFVHLSNKIKISSGGVTQVAEELAQVLALNSSLISLMNQPDAVRFAPGVGPLTLLGKNPYSFLVCF